MNHIIAARNEFAGMFGDLARGKRNWQLVAFGLTAALLLLAAAHMKLAATARVIPYVVEVDRFGRIGGVGRADAMRAPEDRLVASQLAEFVRSVRTVLPAVAAVAQGAMMRRGYALASRETAAFLNDYFADPRNDPRAVGAQVTREIDVGAVLRLPGSNAWRIEWVETDRRTDSAVPPRASAWEGYLTVQLDPPATSDAVQANPLGIHITSVSWTRLADTAPRAVPDDAAAGGPASAVDAPAEGDPRAAASVREAKPRP